MLDHAELVRIRTAERSARALRAKSAAREAGQSVRAIYFFLGGVAVMAVPIVIGWVL